MLKCLNSVQFNQWIDSNFGLEHWMSVWVFDLESMDLNQNKNKRRNTLKSFPLLLDGSLCVSMWFDEERKYETKNYTAHSHPNLWKTRKKHRFSLQSYHIYICFDLIFLLFWFVSTTHTHTHKPSISISGEKFQFCRSRKIKTHTQPNEVFVFSLQIHMSEQRLNINFAHRINNTYSCYTYVIGSAFHRWLRAKTDIITPNTHFYFVYCFYFLYIHILVEFVIFVCSCHFCVSLGGLCLCAFFVFVVLELMPAAFIIFSWAVLARTL